MKRLFVLAFFCAGLAACSVSHDARGIFHRGAKGESLLWVARSYGVELQDLAEMNNIQSTDTVLKEGEKLYIPPRRIHRHKKLPFEGKIARHIRTREIAAVGPLPRSVRKGRSRVLPDRIYTEHNRFAWPVEGAIVSTFGIRNKRRHDGIDIRAKMGTPIRAADAGKVVFADRMRGYGNLVLVRHSDDFFTAYAHNQANKVAKGDTVRKGEVIGMVGKTGRATGPHLHFEVREGEKARNPLFFLPVGR